MRVAMLNPPYRYGQDPTQWITVPPQGYGGIQWVVATLLDGLLSAGCEIILAGAPGSANRPGLTTVDTADAAATLGALRAFGPDVVHDHADNGFLHGPLPWPTVRTHHLTGPPTNRNNAVYLSHAQRAATGARTAPVIRLPVNPDRCTYREKKQEFLLFLGRVSAHKGVREAAALARAAGLPLKVAGPAWEKDYLHGLLTDYPNTVDYLGEVGGTARTELLADACALLALSQPRGGPFGGEWIEPGATVVSEAAASGTPVIASDNGCLPEIATHVGAVIAAGHTPAPEQARQILAGLPTPEYVRSVAVERWGHEVIAAKYLQVYERAAAGETWA
ncbi:glycosyltransferase [Kitasatospora sp. NPDC001664]